MKAYSEDLRKRIVEAVDRGMGKNEAAQTFGVSLSSGKRYVGMAHQGRSLTPKKRPGLRPKIDEQGNAKSRSPNSGSLGRGDGHGDLDGQYPRRQWLF